ncbi:hypothetical protein SAMN04488570_3433 [Nocardioides scoriae]|uniref:Uncharacterized protein n=1 Tax=Nocardioides scoriae TaxID=642780 RepID=A0A1H1XAW9_9ACTN|nr:hypothetical protein [Nocardioides scoriae]SDT06493.1 hypothetical protein SAMN04488570_3433 [Nocardioides scoriae]
MGHRVPVRVEALVGRIEVTRGEAEAVVRRAARVVTDVGSLVRRVGRLPGMGRIRRRLDEEHEAAADAPAAG